MSQSEREYINSRRRHLDLLRLMWEDSLVLCYNDRDMPKDGEGTHFKTIFLAGPTSRNQNLESEWRSIAVSMLRDYGFNGYIYVPEPRGQEREGDFDSGFVNNWKTSRSMSASLIIFWMPRNVADLTDVDARFELDFSLGRRISNNHDTQELFIGFDDDTIQMDPVSHYVKMTGVNIFKDLQLLCGTAVEAIR